MIVAVSSVAIHSETLLAVNRRDRQVYDAAWRQFLAVLVFPLRSFQAQTFGARPAVLIHFVSFRFLVVLSFQILPQIPPQGLLTRLVVQTLVLGVADHLDRHSYQTAQSPALAAVPTTPDLVAPDSALLALALVLVFLGDHD